MPEEPDKQKSGQDKQAGIPGEADTPDKPEKEKENNSTATLYLGLCLGTAFGIIFDNLALGIPLGLCFGAALGLFGKKK